MEYLIQSKLEPLRFDRMRTAGSVREIWQRTFNEAYEWLAKLAKLVKGRDVCDIHAPD